MSSSLKLVTLGLLCVNVACLPGLDPWAYNLSRTIGATEKEVLSYDLKKECDAGWTYATYTRKCYRSSESKVKRSDAVTACKAWNRDAELAKIPDKETNDFVLGFVNLCSWISLEKKGNNWYWADETVATFLYWGGGGPSGDGSYVELCRVTDHTPGMWNDLSGDHKRGFVCQYTPSDPDTDGYLKVFSHNTSGGLFSNKAGVLKSNPTNSNADLFSILYKLEEFKDSNGNFHFKICYPELKGIGGKSCNEWIQSSNPLTAHNITGFRPIGQLAFDKNSLNQPWRGLGSNLPNLQSNTLIDDSPTHWYYYSAIGAFTYWPDSTKRTIPGPRLPNELRSSPITKVELYVFHLGYDLVKRDNLVATLPSWGDYFEVSLQIWIESFAQNGIEWTELFRFAAAESDKDCCSAGDRIPALFANKAGFIYASNQVGSNGDYVSHFYIKAKTWTMVQIKQYPENGKAIYEFIVDGKSVVKTQNIKPTLYENVKVWVSQGKYHPVANARIKDFKYESIRCNTGWTYFSHLKKSIKTNMNRADAIKTCKESKPTASLASIPDMVTNAFVQSLVSWRSWIGLQKFNDQWVWPDGTKATYLPWDTEYGNPSGDGPSVEIWADGKWNDLPSNSKRSAVCQYDTLDVVLITGGAERKSSEIYNPVTKASCSLPQFAEVRAGHTQDGELACGGGKSNCVKWSLASGAWTQSHTLREARVSHLSWETTSGVYLLGGYNTRLTSEKINMDGSVVESFNLKYETREACAIPDPDNGEIIITGGMDHRKLVSVYNEAGWQRDLTQLNQGRKLHACGSYFNGGEKLLLVTGGATLYNGNGGIRIASTEIYSDNAWRIVGNLPSTMWGMSAATFNNRVLVFGGRTGSDQNKILEFNPETESWSEIGTMKERRRHNRVSIVSSFDFAKWCN